MKAASTTVPASMRCPVCRTTTLARSEADARLPSWRCPSCAGQFVRGEQYFAWLDHPDRKHDAPTPAPGGDRADEAPGTAAGGGPADVARAKLCPECRRFMTGYQVGHGVPFRIDRCGTCAGIWFDAREWEALQQRHLHDRVHHVFSAAWQAQLLRERQQRAARERLEARLGKEQFAELQRVAAWIEQHPHRDEVTAYLLEQLRVTEPPAESATEQPQPPPPGDALDGPH